MLSSIKAKLATIAAAAAVVVAFAGLAGAAQDFGLFVEGGLESRSQQLFGVSTGLDDSSSASLTGAEISADPASLATLAKGLEARVVSSGVAAANIDMMVPWPDNLSPTHLIACNEQGTALPGVQRIDISTGAAETIVTGTVNCDGIRMLPWGTILFSEETSDGRAYELIDPLDVTGVSLDRATGSFSGGAGNCPGGTGECHFATRTALGRLAYEGFAVYPNGVIYYGDELRPSNGAAGGAYFKFIPATPWAGGPEITDLSQSPLVSGDVYGLRVGRRSGFADYGQGTQLGFAKWVQLCTGCQASDPNLRSMAAASKLTGYYRPEDIDTDGAALEDSLVRFCGNNTGNEADDQFYGETICITDGTLASATANTALPEVQLLVAGSPAFNMPDNIAYQPGRGNWVIHEDGETTYLTPHNNDLWSCLDDGMDENLQGDGCLRVASLNDLEAEWTGGIFNADGDMFWVSVQHNSTGKGIILEITGWK